METGLGCTTVGAGATEYEEVVAGAGGDGGQVGVVDDQISDVPANDLLGPASEVDTVFYFPHNPTKCK